MHNNVGGRLDGEPTKFTEERAGYKRISRVNSSAAGKAGACFSFLTVGKKSKGNPEKQAQRLRRVSPCFSYNKEKD
ncbi:TPA: hypothetical protein ACOEF8_002534 [Enterobacter roggenkampii]